MPSRAWTPPAFFGEAFTMSDKPHSTAPEFADASLEAWAKAAAKSAPGGAVGALNWVTPDGITVKPLYTAADTAGLSYADTLPGIELYLPVPVAPRHVVHPSAIHQH